MYWENRTIKEMAANHGLPDGTGRFHEVAVGTEHGVVLVVSDKFRLPQPGEWFNAVNAEFFADHLHPVVLQDNGSQRMGDWEGLAWTKDGDLWVAGKWTAGLIRRVGDEYLRDPDPRAYLRRWVHRTGEQAFAVAFGWRDKRPVFPVNEIGEPVHMVAVAVVPALNAQGEVKNTTVFASGPSWSGAGPARGLALWDGNDFRYLSPTRDLGLPEESVRDLIDLPDGRLAIAFAHSGVFFVDLVNGGVQQLEGLRDPNVRRLKRDYTVNPGVLLVATETGATVHVVGSEGRSADRARRGGGRGRGR
jgi:hypothetical protein